MKGEEKMKIVYRPGTGIIEGLVKCWSTANNLASWNPHLKSESFSDFKNNFGDRIFNMELPYVIYEAEFPHNIIALVRTPEMALDVVLEDKCEWRVESLDSGLTLYVRDIKKRIWKAMRHMPDQGTCKETMQQLILEFLRWLPCAEFDISLKGGTVKEYRYIVSGVLDNLSALFTKENNK